MPTKDRANFPDADHRKRRHRLKLAGPRNGSPETASGEPEPRLRVVLGLKPITKKENEMPDATPP